MPEEIDDFTATQLGHSLVRWITDEDPAGVGRFVPDLEPSAIDDAKAARLGRTLLELLERVDIA